MFSLFTKKNTSADTKKSASKDDQSLEELKPKKLSLASLEVDEPKDASTETETDTSNKKEPTKKKGRKRKKKKTSTKQNNNTNTEKDVKETSASEDVTSTAKDDASAVKPNVKEGEATENDASQKEAETTIDTPEKIKPDNVHEEGFTLEPVDLDTKEIPSDTSSSDKSQLPAEYQAAVPESLSKDLSDLAGVTKAVETLSKDESDLLGIFDQMQGDVEDVPADGKHDASALVANTEATSGEPSKAGEVQPKKSIDKESMLSQLKSVMSQQKTLLQKLAAIGNVPVFDPQKFNQLLEALPAIIAWHKSGQNTPQGGTAPQQSNQSYTEQPASYSQPTQLVNGEKIKELSADDLHAEANSGVSNEAQLIAQENEEQIRKNMGIALEQTTVQADGKEVDAKKLASELEGEGFLEATVKMDQDDIPTGSGVTMIGETDTPANRAEDAKRRKMEEAQEKAWAEEAKKRTKELEARRKESAKKEKNKKIDGKGLKITAPKKRKMSKLQAIILKLNYFGLSKNKDEFIDNLGIMMDAGLPLLDALRTLEMEAKQKPYKKLLSKVVVAVETGSPLWRAMDSTYFFDGQQVSMVKVGEEAGNLVENLRYLGEQSAKQRDLRAKVKTAMIYPIIVGVMLTLIIFGLGMFVLPDLIDVIFSLGVELPFITRMIVAFTNVFTEHGTVLLPGLMGGAFVLLMLHKYTRFKVVTQWFVMKIPGIGSLVKESILAQFGVTMGGLLQAGVPVTDALESIANVTSIAKYQKFYYLLLGQIKLGDSFSTAFSKIKSTDKCFPTSMQQLIRTGEKSGSLTRIMLKVSEIHEKKATDIAEKLPVILEPMLLLFIGSLVGTIAIGVLAPIYGIVGNVG